MAAEDPFEAFRKKKVEEQARKTPAPGEIPVERPLLGTSGGIKGLLTHRHEKIEAAPLAPPKGLEPTRLGEGPKGGKPAASRPKGFEPTSLADR